MRIHVAAACLIICGLFAGCIGMASPGAAQGQPLIMAGPCGHDGYHPVCARSRKNTLVTYANACIARSEGSRVLSHGPCPEACPLIFKPVCAIDETGRRKTFANDCIAKAAGVRVIRRGRCIPFIR
jgi:hypothetical protein